MKIEQGHESEAGKAKHYGNRVRISGYFDPELVKDLEQMMESLPYRVSVSGFLETAVRREIDRLKRLRQGRGRSDEPQSPV